jgi:hypothetical protein
MSGKRPDLFFVESRKEYKVTTLSAKARIALRTALTTHPRWEDYKKATGCSIASMGKDDLIAAAKAMEIDIAAVTANASNATEQESTTMKDRSIAPADTLLLNHRLEQIASKLDEKERDLCRDIMKTINQKQNGYATTRQFSTVSNIVSRAEKYSTGEASTSSSAAPVAPVTMPSFEKTEAGAAMWAIIKGNALDDLFTQVSPYIEKALSSLPSTKIEMHRDGVKVGETDGHHHPMFATMCRALSVRAMDGFSPCVWIAGPSGSGKTHAARSFAKAAGLSFHYNGALADAFALLGYPDANGVYRGTEFRKAYEHGGVYLFDEVDGSDNSALLALNGALANGICSFPDRIVERHPDCHIIATGNTHGHGATAEYVGRAKIDAAFLDRFGVRLNWGYDEALELAISGNQAWTKRVQAARHRAGAAGLKVLITPRASITGAALIAGGFTSDEAADVTYLANLSADQKKIVEGRA